MRPTSSPTWWTISAGARTEPGRQPADRHRRGWGLAGDPERLWTLDELVALREQVEAAGLHLEAIENFDPAHWHDVLLDGPKWREQVENLKTMVRRVGEAGIPIIGYNFSLAGVAGRTKGPMPAAARRRSGMEGTFDQPMPNGMVWNMVYDTGAPTGTVPTIGAEELWRRAGRFLRELLPVAEAAGVRLAAHPDDPPRPTVRGQPRLVYQPRLTSG